MKKKQSGTRQKYREMMKQRIGKKVCRKGRKEIGKRTGKKSSNELGKNVHKK